MEPTNTGKLYLVPTPIGNLGDMTLRAIEILRSVDLILAEDTRTTGKLLSHFSIDTPQRSYHIHNEHKILSGVISEITSGKKIALVSDAGTPGISDPGFLLVREALQEDIDLEVLPGPTALVPALLKSGFPTDRFSFEGFLPHKKGRLSRIEKIAREDRTIILYESPHRLVKLLNQLAENLEPTRKISVSRELTKIHEETVTGTVPEVRKVFEARSNIKGEIVLVIEGSKA